MACGRAQTFWTEPGRVTTAYSADKYKDHNEQYKSAEEGNLLGWGYPLNGQNPLKRF